ncbi:MAG: peptidoglycan editing factor PgeF [Alphaproteobacteria bacterium]|nr:peptidoglycan editing factor PgeF [Alphaproteobacteria bacterium]
MLTSGPLNRLDGIRHGFFTREGGVSEGLFASLNCGLGSGDDPARVTENRSRVAAALDLSNDALVTCYQVHSPDVMTVEAPWAPGSGPKVDAMVSKTPGIALGILTADCAPVLLADPHARVIGAAHAGWRGALTGVLAATVKAMAALGATADRTMAAIGPCIAQRSYEVGPEFPAPFVAADPSNERFFAAAATAGKFLFDLRGFVLSELEKAGLRRVSELPHDTCREERFFSYRRACLRGEKGYGRLLSAIALEP